MASQPEFAEFAQPGVLRTDVTAAVRPQDTTASTLAAWTSCGMNYFFTEGKP